MNSNVYIKEYRIEQKKLYITGIQWPKDSADEIVLIFATEGSNRKIELPMKKEKEIVVELPNEEIYQWMREEQLESVNVFAKCTFSCGERIFPLVNKTKKASPNNYKVLDDEKTEDKFCLFHSRHGGNLEISYGTAAELLRNQVITYVTAFKMRRSVIRLEGSVDCLEGSLEHVCLQFRDDESKQYFFPVQITGKTGMRTNFSCDIQLKEVALESFYWDFYAAVRMNESGDLGYSRMKVDSIPVRKDLTKRLIRNTYRKKEYIAFPYMTNGFNLCIQFRERHRYDSISYKLKETVAVWTYKLFKKKLDQTCRWLICEKYSETAQDNSFYFFDYCYRNHKEKEVYYIIDKQCEDYKKMKPYGKRVIPFMSFRHMLYLQANCKLISAEPKIHFYAWKIGRGRVRLVYYDKPYVFLQHGVLGFKKLYNLSKNSLNRAQLFVTSSEFEQKIVTDHFGYDEKEVIVTGLPRWDVLEDKTGQTEKREIILMPTWRLWFEGMTNEQFSETDYFKTYVELMKDGRLSKLLKEQDAHLTFIIHPRLKQYVSEFVMDSDGITIYQFGEIPINELIMKASLLITDYSSISWEMYYMHKPVIFYKFDLEQYEQSQGSYIDSRSEVIGDIVYNNEDLFACMKYFMEHGYKERKKYAVNRTGYFKYQDQNNCRRIYEKICELDR